MTDDFLVWTELPTVSVRYGPFRLMSPRHDRLAALATELYSVRIADRPGISPDKPEASK